MANSKVGLFGPISGFEEATLRALLTPGAPKIGLWRFRRGCDERGLDPKQHQNMYRQVLLAPREPDGSIDRSIRTPKSHPKVRRGATVSVMVKAGYLLW